MNELNKLLSWLKNRYPDKLPTNPDVTEKKISYLQGQQTIIRDISFYIKQKVKSEQDE